MDTSASLSRGDRASDSTMKGLFWGIGLIIGAIVALNFIPFSIILPYRTGEYIVAVVGLLAFLWVIQKVFKAAEGTFSPRFWKVVITVIFFTMLLPINSYIDDGIFAMIFTIALISLTYLGLKNLGKVNFRNISAKQVAVYGVAAIIYFAIGLSYTMYRWNAYVVNYKTSYVAAEQRLSNSPNMTPELLRINLRDMYGPYPDASNYKAQNTRWFVYWPASAIQYFFTDILRDIFEWVGNLLARILNWVASDHLKDFPNPNQKQ